MASTFTDLGLELMATGENAGTWGTKTNANLSLAEQLLGGFKIQTLNAAGTGVNTTALAIADGALTGAAQNRIIILGAVSPQAIAGAKTVTFPLLTETFYFIKNSTSGAHTVTLKAESGSGATVVFSATDKGYKAVYLDGVATNTGVIEIPLAAADGVTLTGTQTLTNKTLTNPILSPTATTAGKVEFLEGTNNGTNKATLIGPASTADVTVTLPAATDTLVGKATTDTLTNKTLTTPVIATILSVSNGDIELAPNGTGHATIKGNTNPASIQLNCESNSHGIKLTSPAHSANQSYELKFPTGNVTADRFLKVASVSGSGTTGIGQLSFSEVSGGTDWQAVKTSAYTAVAGQGVFVNTTSSAFSITLPSSPAIGDEVAIVDYAGTFDSNNCTIARNSKNIQGVAADLVVATERAAFTLVFTDNTQGWLLKNN